MTDAHGGAGLPATWTPFPAHARDLGAGLEPETGSGAEAAAVPIVRRAALLPR